MAGGQTVWHTVRAPGTGRRTGPDACDGGGDPVQAARRLCQAVCTSRRTRQQAHAPRPGWGEVRAGCGGCTQHDLRSPRRGHGRPSAARATGCRRRVVGARCLGQRVPEVCWPRWSAGVSPPRWGHQCLPPRAWEACRRQAVRHAGRASGWRGGACGRAPSPAGHTGPVRRPCRLLGARRAQRLGWSVVAHPARGTPVRRWPRPLWSWWGAWTSQRRALGLLPGCGAPSAHTPSRCAGAGQEGRRGPPRGRGVVPMRPLTTHWSRRQQPSLLRRCGCWRGSPRALGPAGTKAQTEDKEA